MVSKVYNILIFPGGTEIGLEIRNALCQCKNVRLFSAGADISNHAPFVFLRHFILPTIHEPTWIKELNTIIDEQDIDYVFPAFDDIVLALAENREKIRAGIVSSPLETCLLTRSKSMTYKALQGVIPVPRIFDSIDEVAEFPVFVKPDRGQGAHDTHLVHDCDRLQQLVVENSGRIALEYLSGEEYTIDCFSDRDAGLLFCSGRERVRTKSGISMRSVIAPHQEIFSDYARRISKHLDLHGAWFFQTKKRADGTLTLLEIAPRIAGTMALHRAQGINFPLLSIYEQERIPLTILRNSAYMEIDRALTNRYRHDIEYSTVYVDLDDTLVLNGRVNTLVLAFVYQCINKGKKVVLLTKHTYDLRTTLAKFRLGGIFDKIIHLAKTDSKADFIVEHDAILIDDSFSERNAVNEQLGIYTFDCSMLEALLDERL